MHKAFQKYFLIFIAGLAPFQKSAGLPNPAAVYCTELGYEYRVVTNAAGACGLAVVASNVVFDAWDLFRGKTGQAYSLAALCGYEIECVRVYTNGYFKETAICYPRGRRTAAAGVPLAELIRRQGLRVSGITVSAARRPGKGLRGMAEDEVDLLRIYQLMDGRALPDSFDWRSFNSRSYIGAVRDQGACGSCYAFGASAAAEGTYNFARQKYDANCLDFSEAFIIWCLGRKPAYYSHFFGCDGSDYDYAELTALTVEGVCLETAFPYTTVDPGECTHWSDPATVFTSWHRVPCGDIDAIKTAIMTYGVVDAAVKTTDDFNDYAGGIYDDNATNCPASPCYYTPTDHVVALVGWDDNPPEGGGGCWILRNSWGSGWGESGYMRIRYRAARVACEVCYLTYPVASNWTLTVNSAHGGAVPSVGENIFSNGAVLCCSVTNSPILDGPDRYICAGWIGSGSVPASGTSTNTGYFVLAEDSVITWLWQTNTVILPPAWVAASTGTSPFEISIAWAPAMSADRYVLLRHTVSNAASAAVLSDNLTTPAYADTNTVVGGLYYYWVRSVSAGVTSVYSAAAAGWRAGFSACVCADYDGDHLADPTLYTEATAGWHVKLSTAQYSTKHYQLDGLSGRGWAAAAGDYDGDGMADPAAYHEDTGIWRAQLSSHRYATVIYLPYPFGGVGYSAVPADYDRDGYCDVAIYQRLTGTWQVRLSSQAYVLREFSNFLGGSGWIAVPADYDGDGYADPAIYGVATGEWIFRLSSRQYGRVTAPWLFGGEGWWPVPADYDGDGFADPAVRQLSGNLWQARFSGQNYNLREIPLNF